MEQTTEDRLSGTVRRAGLKASYPTAFLKARGCRDLDGDAGSRSSGSAGEGLNSRSRAKEALLAAMEVHSRLTKLEKECNKSYKDTLPSLPEWKIPATAVAAEEEECSEFTSMPSRSSSGMVEAISIKPDSSDLEINFDGHDFGFFGDVGARYPKNLRGNLDEPMNAISEEYVMPWDM